MQVHTVEAQRIVGLVTDAVCFRNRRISKLMMCVRF